MISIESSDDIRAYRRELPGGGFVAIDVQPIRTAFWQPRRYRGEVVVERRQVERDRVNPPVVAHAEGVSVDAVVETLLPAARSNEMIGAALIRLGHVPRVANINVSQGNSANTLRSSAL